jgi:hypothetical protein
MKTATLVALGLLTAALALVPAAAADPVAPASPAGCEPVWIGADNQPHVDPECLPMPVDGSP